jgi:hypothetical protein
LALFDQRNEGRFETPAFFRETIQAGGKRGPVTGQVLGRLKACSHSLGSSGCQVAQHSADDMNCLIKGLAALKGGSLSRLVQQGGEVAAV